jgi:hypothetical protein
MVQGDMAIRISAAGRVRDANPRQIPDSDIHGKEKLGKLLTIRKILKIKNKKNNCSDNNKPEMYTRGG